MQIHPASLYALLSCSALQTDEAFPSMPLGDRAEEAPMCHVDTCPDFRLKQKHKNKSFFCFREEKNKQTNKLKIRFPRRT